MSSRPAIIPFTVLNQAVSGITPVNSLVTIKPLISKITYSVVWTGTLAGTFDVQVSDDYTENSDGSVKNPGSWTSLPLSHTITAAGSPGNGFYEIATGAFAIRLVFTPSSGSGNVTEIVTGQVM